jgi:hypothetical protein
MNALRGLSQHLALLGLPFLAGLAHPPESDARPPGFEVGVAQFALPRITLATLGRTNAPPPARAPSREAAPAGSAARGLARVTSARAAAADRLRPCLAARERRPSRRARPRRRLLHEGRPEGLRATRGSLILVAAELPDGSLGAVEDDERPLLLVVVELDLGRRMCAVGAPAGRPVVGLRAAFLIPEHPCRL